MSDTPLTDHALALCVRDEELVTHPLYDHARKMERDRALLLGALKTTLTWGREYASDLARKVIAEVEKSE